MDLSSAERTPVDKLRQQQEKYSPLLENFAEKLFLAVHPDSSWAEDAILEVFLPFSGYVLESTFPDGIPDGIPRDTILDDETLKQAATAFYSYLMPGEDLETSPYLENVTEVVRTALRTSLKEITSQIVQS
jgi:hypothetical protein